MPKRTTPVATPDRPVWPYPEVVALTAHKGSGQWRKRHRGRDFYFGAITDPDEALRRWRNEWPRILDGKGQHVTERRADQSVTVETLVGLFVTDKLHRHDAGDLEYATCVDYQDVGRFITEHLGASRAIGTLGPGDFDKLAKQAERFSLSRRRKVVIHTRSLFKWAMGSGHIEKLPDYGTNFRVPTAKLQRRAKRLAGARHLSREQIKQLLTVAGQGTMRALILLGLNGGYGNTDAGHLLKTSLHVRPGWLIQPRQKTEAERMVPLWPETLEALERLHTPGSYLLADHKGQPLMRKGTNEIGKMARVVFDAAGLTERTFYDLRRTFITYAAEAKDKDASKLIAGHTIDGIHEGYIQAFQLRRLYAVAFHVRDRLL